MQKFNKKDGKDSLLHDIEYTSSNCSYMQKRLNRWDVHTKIYIIEYSLFSIFLSIAPKYIPISGNILGGIEFLSSAVSIVILVVSLYVTLANYQKRAENALLILNKLKKMKKDVSSISDEDFSAKKYNKYSKRYYRVVRYMEVRDDLDFYRTCITLPSDEHPHMFTRSQKIYYKLSILIGFCFRVGIILIPIMFSGYLIYLYIMHFF